jgi:hypothetical protein
MYQFSQRLDGEVRTSKMLPESQRMPKLQLQSFDIRRIYMDEKEETNKRIFQAMQIFSPAAS